MVLINLNGCVFGRREPGSLSTGACGPTDVLGISGSDGS